MSRRLKVHICWAGDLHTIGGRVVEVHPYFGPILCDEKGTPTGELLDEDDPFWIAWAEWEKNR